MNIVIIMSGGVGTRFGAAIPKQYNLIAGKPVIDYVIDAVLESDKTDRIVVVMDPQWINYSRNLKNSNFDFALNGATRLESMYNGLKVIKNKYACDKVVIVDAVAPFLYADLIDDYFDKLDTYDAVITAQKITGALTDIDNSRLDRDKYVITQSPEGFRFEQLWSCFDLNYPYQEAAGMLPNDSKWFFNYEFRNNLKLTYDFELSYAEYMLQNLGKLNRKNNVAFFDKDILITKGIQSFLLRNETERTLRWIDMIYAKMPELITRYGITSFLPNQISRYGLVLQAKSQKYGGGEIIVKFIPDFVGRYERELEAIRILPKSYMCGLIDADEDCNCMILQKITPARYACFEENLKLTEMFHHVIEDAIPFSENMQLNYIPYYFDELKGKLANASAMPYLRDKIQPELEYAVKLYEEYFSNSPRYILHGDLHEQNILDDGTRFWGIDPNGMLGPIELECVRFIRNDVRNHPSFGYEQRFEILLNSFARFVDIERLVRIFIIDMAYCTYNSVFENEDPQETYVDLQLIQIAKEWIKKKDL